MGKLYCTKTEGQASNGIVKDVDTVKGIITGYGASFNTVDSDNQMFLPGCFKRSLNDNASRLRFLYQHCSTMPLSLFSKIEEDKTGLLFTSDPITTTTWGQDAIKLYADGVLKEHSVGFELLASSMVDDGDGDGNDVEGITEARLWEVSPVTWGANPLTPVVGIKSAHKNNKEYIIERIHTFQKALHRGTLRDDTYTLLEIELKQWESILALAPEESTPPAEKGLFQSIAERLQTTKS